MITKAPYSLSESVKPHISKKHDTTEPLRSVVANMLLETARYKFRYNIITYRLYNSRPNKHNVTYKGSVTIPGGAVSLSIRT